ncbi:AhpC/TSA family protein [Hymenobacter sp. 15J16-1T3B]|uniref:TlpA disulfide reductase family protein n=1 Tax=Hymenobacter sp. 15J16-1T3B TaxID=2886941 RepID=UPI001D105F75|nr:TlpA disulfide reductase family protein [Hymenobacter sp. 15J16-1T3B]MCC3158988.1 AhpC/TSA family protein [Hymenobacter sp. 15J16-1T3B]
MKYPMTSLILVASLLSVSTTACTDASSSTTAAAQAGYEISGQLRNATAGTKVSLAELTDNQFVARTSATTDAQGRFTLNGTASEPALYQLKLEGQKQEVWLVLDNKTKLQLSGDAQKLAADYTVKGSKDSELMQQLTRQMQRSSGQLQSIMERYQANAQAGRQDSMQRLEAKFMATQAGNTAALKSLIRKNPTSVVSAFALGTPQIFNADENFGFADSVATQLKKAQPDSRYTKALVQTLEPLRKTAIGTVAPDIQLTNPAGKVVPLSSLRGQYVLLDFWASWCGPCRQENPNVVKTYEQYKGKKFTIYGVSLDQDKGKWEKAIQADGLTWTHVSDLKGWQSAAGQAYGVQSIPMNFLLDPQGRIIAKNLRGEALSAKLASVLK